MTDIHGQITHLNHTEHVVHISGKRLRSREALFTNIARHFAEGLLVKYETYPDGTLKNMVLTNEKREV